MTENTSAYSISLFVSSTVYNLVDLRAELSRYLRELGYKPMLSNDEGFHDNSPNLAPWESCLNVLETCPIMILIIDGDYGHKFEWKNTEKVIGDRQISPTHAEYVYAHKKKKRILVFVRQGLLEIYQTFLVALKTAKNDLIKKKENKDASEEDLKQLAIPLAKEYLLKTLPKYVSFETLEFIHEVKNTHPIPWVKGFTDVTDIKREIQQKMLNELAEIFLIKTQHLESVFKAFAAILDDLPEDVKIEKLKEFGVHKNLIDQIEKVNSEYKFEKDKSEKLASQLIEKQMELDQADRANSGRIEDLTNKVVVLKTELDKTKKEMNKNKLLSNDLFLQAATGSVVYDGVQLANITLPQGFGGLLDNGSKNLSTNILYQPNANMLDLGFLYNAYSPKIPKGVLVTKADAEEQALPASADTAALDIQSTAADDSPAAT